MFFSKYIWIIYAINLSSQQIDWYLNINQSLDFNPTSLFTSNQIVNFNDKISVSSNNFLYILEANKGSLLYKKNFSTYIKPVINNNYLFTISKNNLLIAVNLKNGEIIYSYDINSKIADFLNTKKKTVRFKNMFIANNNILIFLENSYMLKFDINGEIIDVKKLPSKLKSSPIFINGKMIYLDSQNKISVLN